MALLLFTTHLLFIGTTELLLICGIELLLFGGKKLPEMMRGLGKGVREFKKGVNEIEEPDETPAEGIWRAPGSASPNVVSHYCSSLHLVNNLFLLQRHSLGNADSSK